MLIQMATPVSRHDVWIQKAISFHPIWAMDSTGTIGRSFTPGTTDPFIHNEQSFNQMAARKEFKRTFIIVGGALLYQ